MKKTNTEQILEILGLIEEKGKSKDWILDEIKKHHIKLGVSTTANSTEILKSCPVNFIKHIYQFLKEDEFEIKDIKTPTKTFHWFFTDLVGASKPNTNTKAQSRKINFLNTSIKKSETFRNRNPHNTIILPTGDGMAIGFSESAEQPLRLAIDLHKELNKYNKRVSEKEKVQLRIGIDSGLVYLVKDVEDNDAVWGPGIIRARRIMDHCGPNQIFASKAIGEDIGKLSSEYAGIMHSIGEYEFKHGVKIEIFNIYGKNFGNKNVPKHGKITKPKLGENILSKKPNFQFIRNELKLKVMDPKTMMTRHTFVWHIKKISDIPLREINYELHGDADVKNFEDLNISAFDGKKNKLDIIRIDENRKRDKKFRVGLKKPLLKSQTTVITLNYDWVEPDRIFEYSISGKCKKFSFHMILHPEIQPEKIQVLDVVKDIGNTAPVEPAPKIKTTKKGTEVRWENNPKDIIKPGDLIRFTW